VKPVVTVLVSSRFGPEHLERLRGYFPDVQFVHLPPDGSVPSEGRSATVLFRCGMPKPALQKMLADAPEIRWIQTCTAGVEWLLVPEVVERSIAITRSVTTFSVPIGEWVIGCIFLMAKRYQMLARLQAERTWMGVPHEPPADSVGGKTVAIVGTGAIGQEVAWRAAALGMRVIGLRRSPRPTPHFECVVGPEGLPTLLKEADYLVLSSPLTPETRGMIGEAQLRQMKRTAYLINVGRGALTVESDVVTALKEGWIAGACIDVFEQEPLPADHPFWGLSNALITPHYSYSSPEGNDRAVEEFRENLTRYLAGEPLANQYDAGRGY
jgi:phosphoglycerate dehydrogenase-like enzyme